MRDKNYPDDIHQYDDDPRSPFFVDPLEWMVEAAENLAEQWRKDLGNHNYIEPLDWNRADVDADRGEQDIDFYLFGLAYKYIEKYQEDFEPIEPEPPERDLNWD